ncbi:lysE type translocator family protein [Acinetobacter baumannii 6112]|nr:lysE type translocator family protein [Acinetobacter baumannii 6112]
MSVETILWFCFVTFIFSLPSFRVAYRNFSKWIDGISGGIFTVFGIFLIGNR